MTRAAIIVTVSLSLASPAFSAEPKPRAVYTDCVFKGSAGNPDGYTTTDEDYQCAEGAVRLKGKWGLEIQDGWRYHLELGRPTTSDYVGDLTPEQQMPKFQLWERTPHGGKLVGWNEIYNEQERLKLQELSKNPRPYQKDGR